MEKITFETILSVAEIEAHIHSMLKNNTLLSNSLTLLFGDITRRDVFEGYCVNGAFKLTGYSAEYRKTIEVSGSITDTGCMRLVTYDVQFLRSFDWLLVCFVLCLFFSAAAAEIFQLNLYVCLLAGLAVFSLCVKLLSLLHKKIIMSASQRIFNIIVSGQDP